MDDDGNCNKLSAVCLAWRTEIRHKLGLNHDRHVHMLTEWGMFKQGSEVIGFEFKSHYTSRVGYGMEGLASEGRNQLGGC